MNMSKQLSRKWKLVKEQALATLVAWALIFVPNTGAAQEKSQPQKAVNAPQPTKFWSRYTKRRLFVQSVVMLMAGFLSARLAAQTSVPPKKFIFVQSVGSDPPPAAQSSIFLAPAAVAIGPSASSGSFAATIYVADPRNNQVVAFPPGSSAAPTFFMSLTCPSTVGGCLGPLSSPWTLKQPTSVAVDPNTGNLWISDTGNDVVVEVDPNSSTVLAFAGVGPHLGNTSCTVGGTVIVNKFNPTCTEPRINEGQGPGQFLSPGPIAVDISGNVYVADGTGQASLGPPLCLPRGPDCAFPVPPPANFRIEKFNSSGRFLTTFGGPGSADGQFGEVAGLAVDNSHNVYLSDMCQNRIEKFDTNGTFLLQWGSPLLATGCLFPVPPSSLNFGDGMLNVPGGIAVDPIDQSVYVVDQGSARIQQFDGQGNFLSKGGSNGAFEAQFNMPYAIATVPPSLFAIACALAGASDCAHALVVAELPLPAIVLTQPSDLGGGCLPTTDPTCIGGNNLRVQFLAARTDQDKDGITDEVDVQPTTSSNDFSDASLGFTTTGSIVDRGQQTFTIYNLLSPTPADITRLGSSACNSTGCDEIRIRTETFGPSTPLKLTWCGKPAVSLPAGTGVNIHCSTPTVFTEEGPVGFSFVGNDGTAATATLNTGDSLSVDVTTSKITSNAGTLIVTVGGKTVSLSPGQSTFADTTAPTFNCLPPTADGIWHATNQIFSCTAQDNLDGLSSGSPASFPLMTTVPAGVETANALTTMQALCDQGGNCAVAGPIGGNMVDRKLPTISISAPGSGTTYAANQSVSAAYACTDLGSGVATCTGTVANGSQIDTTPNGTSTTKTFTVSAADKVGNSASQSDSYSVSCHYVALGISPSTVTRGSAITVTGTVMSCKNVAQTVSVKFTLTGPLGPRSCANTSTVMFTVPPFTIQAGTSKSVSFPFFIPKSACAGPFTITTTTLVGGTPVDSTSATLTVQ